MRRRAAACSDTLPLFRRRRDNNSGPMGGRGGEITRNGGLVRRDPYTSRADSELERCIALIVACLLLRADAQSGRSWAPRRITVVFQQYVLRFAKRMGHNGLVAVCNFGVWHPPCCAGVLRVESVFFCGRERRAPGISTKCRNLLESTMTDHEATPSAGSAGTGCYQLCLAARRQPPSRPRPCRSPQGSLVSSPP